MTTNTAPFENGQELPQGDSLNDLSPETNTQKNPNATEIDPVTGFRRPPTISVHLQPEEKIFEMPRVKSAGQLLKKLDIRPATALVVRNGELLTPDRPINHGDHLLVRKVTSRG